MPGAIIKKNSVIQYSIIAENSVVNEGATIGTRPEEATNLSSWGITVVGAGITIGENATISAGAMIKENVKAGDSI